MSTLATEPVIHYSWCDVTRCEPDPVDGSVLHSTAPIEWEGEASVQVMRLDAWDGTPDVRVCGYGPEIDLSPERLVAYSTWLAGVARTAQEAALPPIPNTPCPDWCTDPECQWFTAELGVDGRPALFPGKGPLRRFRWHTGVVGRTNRAQTEAQLPDGTIHQFPRRALGRVRDTPTTQEAR